MKQFSQRVIEGIGYYVYILRDPENRLFYVGKGKGNRVFQHLYCALESPMQSDKLDRIREIVQSGKQVQHYILRHGLNSEKEALEIESACIDLLGLDNLTNEVAGHKTMERGLKSIDEINQFYDAEPVDIIEPSIIININRLFDRFMKPEELYNATRSSWILGKKRNEAKYAIAAYRGLVREIYKIDRWNEVEVKNEETNKIKVRWEFEGIIAEPIIRDKYINKSLGKYIVKGGQNPIRYTF